MGEADQVIVSAIENLGNFLLKKADLRDDERYKLRIMVFEKADLRSVMVAMAELLEDNKEMLYRLLVRVAYPFNLEEDEEEERVINIEEKRRRKEVKAEKLSSLVFEMADLWEDDDRESIYKEKLHTLLLHMVDYRYDRESIYRDLCSLAIEMAEDGKGKLRKEKLYRWLAKKADLCDQKKLGKGKLRKEKLYRWLAKMADLWDRKKPGKGKLRKEKLHSWLAKKADLWGFQLLHHLTTPPWRDVLEREVPMKEVLKKVEEAKNDLMIILDIIN